ncbi:MAG TPA: ABC transporter permease [Bacillota bacterium]|nr:ABC transporter permease [Bacillota bacterium]
MDYIEKTRPGLMARLSNKNYRLIYIIIVLAVLFSLNSNKFLSVNNLSNMLLSQVTVSCIAIGALIILIIGEFDLSLGYMIGFVMMLGAYLFDKNVNVVIVIIAMVCSGSLAGLVSGILTVKFHVSSFISTLAVGITLSGLTIGLSNGAVLSNNISPLFIELGQSKIFGVGWCVWIFILICAIMYFCLEFTSFGRSLYAIGGSQKVSFMAGIKTDMIRILAFVLSGTFTSIAAIFQLGQSGAAFPSFGLSLLMPAYAIAFLSVTTYRPGFYNVVGLMLSVIVLGIGVNGLSILGAPFWAEHIYNGAVLLFAVLTAAADARAVKVG